MSIIKPVRYSVYAFRRRRRGGTSPSYSTEVQAVIDQGTSNSYSIPGASALSALDTFVTGLKSAGIYSIFDALYVCQGSLADFSRMNIIDPTEEITNGGASFNSASGWIMDGVSTYLHIGITPVNHQSGDASTIGYFSQNGSALSDFISSSMSPAKMQIRLNSPGLLRYEDNTTVVLDGGLTQWNGSNGMYFICRDSNTTGYMSFEGNDQTFTEADTSNWATDYMDYIGRRSTAYDPGIMHFYGVGGALSIAQKNTVRSLWGAYQAAV